MSAIEPNPIANDARKTLRRRQVPDGAGCLLCGETAPEVLIRAARPFLESHHLSGEANDPDLVGWLCRNCHALVTEAQRDLGVTLTRERRPLLERLIAAFRSVLAMVQTAGERLAWWIERLERFRDALDTAWPSWRNLPEAY